MSTGEQEGDYWARLWRRGFRGQSTGALAEKKRKIFGEGKYFMQRRRQTEKEFGEGKYFFAEEKKNGERRGGKYLDKESIVLL